ncbi:hypothetical protein I352_06299 [Cryptococcus deuterogattii MMRL2647]|nr:hypothetical protein I352_06299 [Cryptococcus deuterogattii MMRL2647]
MGIIIYQLGIKTLLQPLLMIAYPSLNLLAVTSTHPSRFNRQVVQSIQESTNGWRWYTHKVGEEVEKNR